MRYHIPPCSIDLCVTKLYCSRCETERAFGSNATIVGGIVIGARAIVGAGSVVTRSVRDGAVVAGNPARELNRKTAA